MSISLLLFILIYTSYIYLFPFCFQLLSLVQEFHSVVQCPLFQHLVEYSRVVVLVLILSDSLLLVSLFLASVVDLGIYSPSISSVFCAFLLCSVSFTSIPHQLLSIPRSFQSCDCCCVPARSLINSFLNFNPLAVFAASESCLTALDRGEQRRTSDWR